MTTMQTKENSFPKKTFIGFGIGIIGLWAVTVPVLTCFTDKVDSRGQIGDAFGSVNALFSGLAFLGVIAAIFLQREELRLQRQELADTRAELKRQADAAEGQRMAIIQQKNAMLMNTIATAANALAKQSPLFAQDGTPVFSDSYQSMIHSVIEMANAELQMESGGGPAEPIRPS